MKKITKKLSLNKNVVTQLNAVVGGEAPTKSLLCTAVSCPVLSCVPGGTCAVTCVDTCGFSCNSLPQH